MILDYALFDTLLEPVFVLNSEQKIVYCNETASIVADMSVRKLTRGILFDSVFTFSEPIDVLTKLSTVTDPTPYKELNFTTQSGSQGKVQITIQPLKGFSTEPEWIVFVRDVTLEERLQKKYRAELEQKEDVIKDLEKAKLQLEDYSKNLEKMVAERTKQLSSLNQKMSALLDSLGQGFFIFNSDGLCLEVNSKACQDTVETMPAGKHIWEVLKVADNKVENFKKWMMTVFMEMLPFEDLAPLGPSQFDHSGGKNISLQYFPLRTEEGAMDGVVVVATDITDLVEAKKQAEREKEYAKLIINLVKSKREISRFARDSEQIFFHLNNELKNNKPDLEAVYRYLHTLKGGAASFSIQEMAHSCHDAETLVNTYKELATSENLEKLKQSAAAVSVKFNEFQNNAQEILGKKTFSQDRTIEISYSKVNQLIQSVQKSTDVFKASEIISSEVLMEPIGSFFEPYKELTARLAEQEGKQIAPVEMHNTELLVLPEVYSQLFSTFVHAFRNNVDHGIEFPAARQEKGKKPEGKISVYFEIKNSDLIIKITDDGGGIDPQKIRAKLAAKSIQTAHESDEQVIQHIFDSQFSTRDVVTETSGRGVGMDAIKSASQSLGGSVYVKSEVHKGTELTVCVPYIKTLDTKIKIAA